MAIRYRVYVNDGFGGPVDFSAPVADFLPPAGQDPVTWAGPPLAAGSDHTWAVGPYDDVTGLEDRSSAARVRVLVDGPGDDATGRPVAPQFLHAEPGPGGSARVNWYYPTGLSVAGFHVYAWASAGAPNLTAPAGAVGATPGGYDGSSHARPFSFLLTGLSDGVAYSVLVRGYNAAGEGGNTATASVTGSAAGPLPPRALTAAPAP